MVTRCLWALFSALLLSADSYGQVALLPGIADTINYTHVIFEVPHSVEASSYEILISGTNNPSQELSLKGDKNYFHVQSGLSFHTAYKWRYRYYDKSGQLLFTSPATDVYIRGRQQGDTAKYRNLVSIYNKKETMPGYIVQDNGTIMNRKGEVVWTFPADKFGVVRCLDFNENGNLTFLWNIACYETDLRGNIIWKSTDTSGGYSLVDYHHECRKLDNGNYLCIARRITGEDKNPIYSIVFEIDPHNQPKWIWDEKDYYGKNIDFKGSHMNAAFYDTKKKMLYISNYDLSSIVKIDIEKKAIVYSIGYDFKDGTPYYPGHFFNRQHEVTLLPGGDLLLFNNNANEENGVSSVIIMSQPTSKSPPKIKWEYKFDFKDPAYNSVGKRGGVSLLPDNHLLICMGANNRTLEVNRDKEIVWQSDAEDYDSLSGTFRPMSTGYRADFTPSLYPVYFVTWAEHNNVVIENGGVKEDRYVCRFIFADGSQKTITTKPVAPGDTIKIPIPGDKIKAHSIEISSLRNNNLRKILVPD